MKDIETVVSEKIKKLLKEYNVDYFSIFLMVITGNKPLKISIFKNDTS